MNLQLDSSLSIHVWSPDAAMIDRFSAGQQRACAVAAQALDVHAAVPAGAQDL
ncbi:hypothetical protein LP414_03395 [Polaromonas sp. P1(28)-13]|nr:hypothetical protein LP414_03395 [Polaromonas sp. P1(28)-13]